MDRTEEASVTTVMPASIRRESFQKWRKMARRAGKAVVQSVRVMGVPLVCRGVQKDA
ncbi:hypothetical protein D3C87_2053190 [compost metagenome]